MPVSKKRKKKGKKVGNGGKYRRDRLERFGEMESGVSLQDLINVVAYQDTHQGEFPNVLDMMKVPDHHAMPNDGKPQIHYAGDAEVLEDGNVVLPVVIYENGEKRQVGHATFDPDGNMLNSVLTEPVPGITDGEHHYSIGFDPSKEN